MGRIEHGRVGGQVGADVERIKEVEKKLDLVYCEMEPGDALFFHCNTLHRSDQNKSENPRRALICCYNMARNSSYKKGAGPSYTPLERVSANAIREFAVKSAPKG